MTTTHAGNPLAVSANRLSELLKDFPERVQRNVINSAASAGATVVVRQAKQNLRMNGSVRSGTLLKSITKRKKRRVHGVYEIFSDATAPHSHLVEFGTGPRKFKRPRKVQIEPGVWVTVTHTGTMPARPFFRPALDETHQEIMRRIVEQTAKRMAKEAEKMSQSYRTMSKNYRRMLAK